MSSVTKLPHTLSAQLVWFQAELTLSAELRFSSSGETISYLPGGALNGFKAKLDDLSLSGEAIPLGSCDAKC